MVANLHYQLDSNKTKSSAVTPTDTAPQFYQKHTPLYLIILLPHLFEVYDARYRDNLRAISKPLSLSGRILFL